MVGRRGFIAGILATGAFPALASSAASPSGKVNMAFIGIGHQAWNDLSMFAYYRELVNVVALCDTHLGSPRTVKALRTYPGVPRYRDFRKLFDEMAKEIDAVCIATPDFSHFPAAMLAMSLGKAVYSEKPMSNCFREIGLMTAAAARHKVVTQMGNQGHSDANYWQMKTLVEKGYVRDVHHIDAFMSADNRRWFKWQGSMKAMPPPEPVPDGLDWNVWLSQRPQREYNHNFMDGDWRCFYEYGTGALGDWGAHLFDAAHEFLRLGLPTRIETLKNDRRTDVVYPMASTIRYTFPARGEGLCACTLDWYDGAGNFPAMPGGVTDPKWKRREWGAELQLKDGRVFSRVSHGSPLQLVAGGDPQAADVRRTMKDFPKGRSGHYLNFVKAVKGEERTNSPFSVAGPLSQVLALGAAMQRMGLPRLDFDPSAGRFIGEGAATANALLDGPPVRNGWEEFARM